MGSDDYLSLFTRSTQSNSQMATATRLWTLEDIRVSSVCCGVEMVQRWMPSSILLSARLMRGRVENVGWDGTLRSKFAAAERARSRRFEPSRELELPTTPS
jgi:hypothetical protein